MLNMTTALPGQVIHRFIGITSRIDTIFRFLTKGYRDGYFMIRIIGRLWVLPDSKKDRWLLRSGLILLISGGFFSLVSGHWIFWVGLAVGALLSSVGLAQTTRNTMSKVDKRLAPYRTYRVLRWILMAVLFIAYLVGVFLLELAESDSKDDYDDLPFTGNMPNATVDAVWESDPTRYYDQDAPR